MPDTDPFLDPSDAAAYAADTAAALPDDDALKSASQLARELVMAEADVQSQETLLAAAVARRNSLRDHVIPTRFLTLGISGVDLSNGGRVEIAPVLDCSPAKRDKPAVISWLRANGQGDLVKTFVGVSFGKGQERHAAALAAYVEKEYVKHADSGRHAPLEVATDVHPQTLKAFVRRWLGANKVLDEKLFGVYRGSRAVITPPPGEGDQVA